MELKNKLVARSLMQALAAAGLLGALPVTATLAAHADDNLADDSRGVVDSRPEVEAWHDAIKQAPPMAEGCFHAVYPSLNWVEEACQEVKFRSTPRPPNRGPSTDSTTQPDTVGNGYDYSARTANNTRSAVGSFPTVSGVTSASTTDYTLQLNTNYGPSPTFCSAKGYTNCQTWQQFIYSSNYSGSAGTGVAGAQAFMQDWLFLTSSDYRRKHCPSGWNSYSAQYACWKNSSGVAVSAVALSSLAQVTLTGSASTTGNDTVTFTYGTTAKAVSQAGSTLYIGSTWNQSEFNVVGNGGGSGAYFNPGSALAVRVAVNDGTANAPTCLGPSNGGSTGETNNLTLGTCTTSSGTTPYIQFTESN